MNPRFFLRIRTQENRENVEKSEISEPKNETFGGKSTPVILKANARNGANTGLQPDRKRGQRKSVPFVNGGKVNHERIPSTTNSPKLSIAAQSCVVVNAGRKECSWGGMQLDIEAMSTVSSCACHYSQRSKTRFC